jgi:hypothetical protein
MEVTCFDHRGAHCGKETINDSGPVSALASNKFNEAHRRAENGENRSPLACTL